MMIKEKEKQILKAIHQYIKANSISPSVRNIGDLVGIESKSTVHNYIKGLEKEGYISKKDIIPRSIVMTKKGLILLE